jgi:hypothetical protein
MAPKALPAFENVSTMSTDAKLLKDLQSHHDFFDELVNRFPAAIYIQQESSGEYNTVLVFNNHHGSLLLDGFH